MVALQESSHCRNRRITGIVAFAELSYCRISRIVVRRELSYVENDRISRESPDAENISYYLTASKKLTGQSPKTEAKTFEYEGLSGSVVFETDLLESSMEILGTPYLEVEVATEAEDLDLFVYLRNAKASGEAVIVRGNHDEPSVSFCRGFWRLSHRDENAGFPGYQVPRQNPAAPAGVEKGKFYTVRVPLHPTSFILEAGTKLQVEIGSVDEKAMIPPMRHEGGDRTKKRFTGKNILHSNGRIVVPVVKR